MIRLMTVGAILVSTICLGAESPNLVIIMTDEHNFRTIGCYRDTLSTEQALMWGSEVVETPNIDWLADNGTLCTSFYASTPVCSPSRASFITGMYPQNTPVMNNNIPLNDSVITFAEILSRQGYATSFVGKWHLDGFGKPQWAPKRKFGFADNRYMFNRGHWKQLTLSEAGFPKVDTGDTPSYSVKGATKENFSTDWLMNRTVDFINAHQEKPFCVMLSLPDPHGPDAVRPPYDTMYQDMTFSKPRNATDKYPLPSWAATDRSKDAYQQSAYYGMVKCIDDNIAKLYDTLRSNGQLDNTIIVFTSDHGDLRGEHNRQNKGVPYEASAKVPFIIYYKNKIKAGSVINETLSSVDFMSTILPLMGFTGSGHEEGRDVGELFTSGVAPKGWNDLSVIRSTGGEKGHWIAAVSDHYKLVYASDGDPWLFDLKEDPDELINFINDESCREEIRELGQGILQYGEGIHDPYLDEARIKADIEWSINGQGKYPLSDKVNPEVSAGQKKAKGKKKARKEYS